MSSNSRKLEKLVERLKIRLDLAKFKCRYGYEKIDLYTLESNMNYQYKVNNNNNNNRNKKSLYPMKEYQKNKYNRIRKKTKIRSVQYNTLPPLSEKRSTSTDESTAKLLLWMYQHETKLNENLK
ncbi:unnamed protein product [Cunninghamella blakesleeana]